MRDGRLLVQSAPDNLLRAYNTTVSEYIGVGVCSVVQRIV